MRTGFFLCIQGGRGKLTVREGIIMAESEAVLVDKSPGRNEF